MAAVIGALSVKLGLVTVEWSKATKEAKAQAKDLQNALNSLGVDMTGLKNLFRNVGGAMGLSTAGFGLMARSVLQLSGNLQDLSESYDVSIAKILQFQDALIQAGGHAEDSGKILSSIFSKISEAKAGNEQAVASFQKLGISFEELVALNPEQALTRVYQGLASIGNTYDRIKATKDILGKGGLHKSVEEIAAALGKSVEEFRRQEDALKKWADLGDRLDKTILNLKLAFAEFFSVFTKFDAIPSINQFKAAMLAITAAGVISGMFRLVEAFRALNVALRATASFSVALSAAGGVKGIAMATAAIAAYYGAMKAFGASESEVAGGGSVYEGQVDRSSASDNTGRRELAAQQAKLDLTKQMLEIDKRRGDYEIAFLQMSKDELELGQSALKYEEDAAKAQYDRVEALKAENLSIEQKANIEKQFALDMVKASQDRQQRDDLINAKREIAIELLRQQVSLEEQSNQIKIAAAALDADKVNLTTADYERQKELISLQQTLLEIETKRAELRSKWKDEMLSPEASSEMNRLNAQEDTERALSLIRLRAIDEEKQRQTDFVTGWNYAFDEYIKEAQNAGKRGAEAFQSVISNMDSALSEFVRTGKLSFKSLARSIIQDLLLIQMRAQMTGIIKMFFPTFGVPAFAEGGEIKAGQLSVVGEKGPELFVPKTAGTIIPNNRMQATGNTTNVTNNYISAIDTKSFEDRIYGSSQAVWAANQYAGKSLATSRGRT